jgi:hypothetical protein
MTYVATVRTYVDGSVVLTQRWASEDLVELDRNIWQSSDACADAHDAGRVWQVEIEADDASPDRRILRYGTDMTRMRNPQPITHGDVSCYVDGPPSLMHFLARVFASRSASLN